MCVNAMNHLPGDDGGMEFNGKDETVNAGEGR